MKKFRLNKLVSGFLCASLLVGLISPISVDAKSISKPGQYGAVINDRGYVTTIGSLNKPTVSYGGTHYKNGKTVYFASDAYVKVTLSGLLSNGYTLSWAACNKVQVTDDNGQHGHIAGSMGGSDGTESYWMYGEVDKDNLIKDKDGEWYHESNANGKSTVKYTVKQYNSIKYFVQMAAKYSKGTTDSNSVYGTQKDWLGTVSAMVAKPTSDETLTVDTKAPTVTATPSGTNAKGYNNVTWYKDSVKIDFKATDTDSGVKSITIAGSETKGSSASKNYTSSTSVSYSATDNVGNKSKSQSISVSVDAKAPAASAAFTRVSTTGSSAVCRFNVFDSESGVVSTALSNSANTPSSGWTNISTNLNTTVDYTINSNGTYYLHAKDAVGHTACVGTYNIIVDEQGPSTTSKLYSDSGCTKELTANNGWYNTIPSWAKFVATDNAGVSSFVINKAEKVSASQTTITSIEQISADGKYVWNYTARDGIGNSSNGVLAGNFDATKPNKLSYSRINDENTKDGADFNIKASDNLSGLNKVVLYKDTLNDISTLDKNTTDFTKLSYKWQEHTSVYFKGDDVIQGALNDNVTVTLRENGIYKYVVYDCAGNAMDSTAADSGDGSGGIIPVDDIDTQAPTVKAEPLFNSIYPGIEKAYSNTIDGLVYYNSDAALQVEATEEDEDAEIDKGCYTGIGYIGLKYKSIVPATYDDNGNMLTAATTEDVEVYEEYTDKIRVANKAFDISDAATENFVFYAKDRANNKSDEKATTVYIDRTVPTDTTFESLTDLSKPVADGGKVQLRATGMDTQSGIRWVVLMRAGDDGIFKEDTTADVSIVPDDNELASGVVPVTYKSADVTFDVTGNGFYKVRYVDNVGNAYDKNDTIIYVDVFDSDKPDGLSITKNTEKWVNEETGVILTSSARDENSGIAKIETMAYNASINNFETVQATEYTVVEDENSDTYTTHVNNFFKAKATDAVGNKIEMDDSEAVEVANIDPVNPTVKATVGSGTYSAEGCPVTITASDKESGLKNIRIEIYEGNDQWKDITNSSKYETAKSFNTNARGALSAAGSSDAQLTFYLKENGTYRVIADDVVLNQGATEALTVSGVDTAGPVITVTGNPTKWTNKDADITVKAVDSDGSIAEMTLDGKKQDITVASTASFVYKATKNGTHEITATDSAGNTSSYTLNITKIDKDDPVVSYKLKNYNTSLGTVDVVMTIKDELSGVDKAYLNNFKLSTDGSNEVTVTKNVTYSGNYQLVATDAAGNKTTTEIKTKRKLVSIEVITPPDKTDYTEGEDFDKTGMVVSGTYDDGSTAIIEDYEIVDGDNLKPGKDKINIKYTEDGETYKTSTPITVKDKDKDKDDDTTPSKSTTPKARVLSPRTNDDTPLYIIGASIIVVVAGIITVIVLLRRKRKH